jgi:hypothetical protein
MYLTMRVKVGGMTDHPIVVGVVLAADHRQAQGQCFVVGHGCSITFDGWHGSMKPEGRRTIMGGGSPSRSWLLDCYASSSSLDLSMHVGISPCRSSSARMRAASLVKSHRWQ